MQFDAVFLTYNMFTGVTLNPLGSMKNRLSGKRIFGTLVFFVLPLLA
jgi:hypothetical protein